jgi:hypothetical protein
VTVKRILLPALAAGLCLGLVGCGDGRLQTPGRVVRNGQPLIPKDDESVRVTFVPILPDGQKPRDHYFAEFNPSDGTFRPAGKDKKGMPPGKYRVAVEFKQNKQDVFAGQFDENRSPFVFDVDSGTREIVIDLDHPPSGAAAPAVAAPQPAGNRDEPQRDRDGRVRTRD